MSGFFSALRKQLAPDTGVGAPHLDRSRSPHLKPIEGPASARPESRRELDRQPSSRSFDREEDPQTIDDGDKPDPRAERTSAKAPTVRYGNRLQDAIVDNELVVDWAKVKVVSAEVGTLAATDDQRKVLCFLSDGRLVVAAGAERYSGHVMSYITLLERHSVPHTPVQTRVGRIVELYEQGGGTTISLRKSELETKTKAIVSSILNEATKLEASDIHLLASESEATLAYRIDGDLTPIREYDREFGMRLIRTLYQVIAHNSADTFKENDRLDARIAKGKHLPDVLEGVRLATTPTGHGNKLVARLLYAMKDASYDLRDNGFSDIHDELMLELKELPVGLNIISGPTGSGKSTTLQRTLLGLIALTEGKKHVITCEDPIEYPIPGAVQTPVGMSSNSREREEKFVAAIMSCMRLDPDILMIGEIRDLPSAQLALRAATTGHQVWTTLHANNAMKIASRLINMGMEKDMLLDHDVTTGLISQRLVKKLCPHCKQPLHAVEGTYSPRQVKRMQQLFGDLYEHVHVTGKGCEHCRNGTAGRTVVVEVIRPDQKLFEIMAREATTNKAERYWIERLNGKTFMQHSIDKAAAGLIDPFSAAAMLGPLISDIEKLARQSKNMDD